MSIPDERTIEVQARAAGLDLAWTNFREDVVKAALQVAEQKMTLDLVPPADEPWPPMYVARKR